MKFALKTNSFEKDKEFKSYLNADSIWLKARNSDRKYFNSKT